MLDILATIQQQDQTFFTVLQSVRFLHEQAEKLHNSNSLQLYQGLLFLLYKYPDLRAVPTQDIDDLLHTHLSDPDYSEDCYKLFNNYIVHSSATDELVNQFNFQFTKVLFEREFNVPYGWQAAGCDVFRYSS
jgi:arginyl-tRNA--protein-N-Asp/Glu arginylyltransferase